jgi:hypothetical protein
MHEGNLIGAKKMLCMFYIGKLARTMWESNEFLHKSFTKVMYLVKNKNKMLCRFYIGNPA